MEKTRNGLMNWNTIWNALKTWFVAEKNRFLEKHWDEKAKYLLGIKDVIKLILWLFSDHSE